MNITEMMVDMLILLATVIAMFLWISVMYYVLEKKRNTKTKEKIFIKQIIKTKERKMKNMNTIIDFEKINTLARIIEHPFILLIARTDRDKFKYELILYKPNGEEITLLENVITKEYDYSSRKDVYIFKTKSKKESHWINNILNSYLNKFFDSEKFSIQGCYY